jgi:hypothetical protein
VALALGLAPVRKADAAPQSKTKGMVTAFTGATMPMMCEVTVSVRAPLGTERTTPQVSTPHSSGDSAEHRDSMNTRGCWG